MRSERVVVRVVVLEGTASAVQMHQFTHFSVIKPQTLELVPRHGHVLQTTIELYVCFEHVANVSLGQQMPFLPTQPPEQLPALNAFPDGGGAGNCSGNCCLVEKNKYSF